MGNGVNEGFAQSGFRDGEAFNTLRTAVGDASSKVFGQEKVERFLCLSEQITFDDIVVEKIGIGAKEPDLHIGTRSEFSGI